MAGQRLCRLLGLAAALSAPLTTTAQGADPHSGSRLEFEPLVRIQTWPAASSVIGYRGRVWFTNSVKFENHNSADLYSVRVDGSELRFERHLMSQDSGDPVVHRGLLYWPFEDPRLSRGLGEFAVTDGSTWAWRDLAPAFNFHVHAMHAAGDRLYAAPSGWIGSIQRSMDGGRSWTVVYEHPTPRRRVSRFTSLASLDGVLFAGLTARYQRGIRLFRLQGETMQPVAGWPLGRSSNRLARHGGWIYAVHRDEDTPTLWRTDGNRVQQIPRPEGNIQDLISAAGSLWILTGAAGSGRLWQSRDGVNWIAAARLNSGTPIDLAYYRCKLYVGSLGVGNAGELWSAELDSDCPEASTWELEFDAPVARAADTDPLLPDPPLRPSRPIDELITELDGLLTGTEQLERFGRLRQRLHDVLSELAASGDPRALAAMAERVISVSNPQTLSAIGGNLPTTVARAARWYLLGALARAGGRVPPQVLDVPWQAQPNPPEKYFEPLPAAAWALVQARQDTWDAIDKLVAQTGRTDLPDWAHGDVYGALRALTAQPFGYDGPAWRAWWQDPMVTIPGGLTRMGDRTGSGEPSERPAHLVQLATFSLDRYETTNREFEKFAARTGYVTDAETSGEGWHWDGQWRAIPGANWRAPHGPASSITHLASHPVVQVSWNDAQAYCRWRGKRLPTEAEWERATRGGGERQFAWGNQPPSERRVTGDMARASYGTDQCCAPSDSDGYRFTAPVGQFPAGRTPQGVHDLTGNVWEWVEDSFDPTYYQRSPELAPVNRSRANSKVIRGGGWGNNPWGLRATLRHANPPEYGLSMVGFRCAS